MRYGMPGSMDGFMQRVAADAEAHVKAALSQLRII
jgi:hypothetical protein